jgi:Flp pilus assembly protein TadD
MKHAPFGITPSSPVFDRCVAGLNAGFLTAAVVLTSFLAPQTAQADEYGDVNQLVRAGQWAQALGLADKYLSTKPRDPQMRFLKGVILTESGKSAEAVAVLQALTIDFPELPEPYNNLAVLYADQRQLDKARAALEMAIRTNPNYAIAYENLGDVYVKLAMQSYAKAQQLDASNLQNPRKLGLLQQALPPVATPAAAVKPDAGKDTAITPAAAKS